MPKKAAPGKPEPKGGKPYIWVTWILGMLSADGACVYSAWFRARFWFAKRQRSAEAQLALSSWTADHTSLLRAWVAQLEADGWTVWVENQNAWTIEGKAAILAGKMDIVARKGDRVIVGEGKTGERRDKDIWQVKTYMMALPLMRRTPESPGHPVIPDAPGTVIEGCLRYRDGGPDLVVSPAEFLPVEKTAIVAAVRQVSDPAEPRKMPSRNECDFCDIGKDDCPQRIDEATTTTTEEF